MHDHRGLVERLSGQPCLGPLPVSCTLYVCICLILHWNCRNYRIVALLVQKVPVLFNLCDLGIGEAKVGPQFPLPGDSFEWVSCMVQHVPQDIVCLVSQPIVDVCEELSGNFRAHRVLRQ